MIALKQHGDGLRHLEQMTVVYTQEMLEKMEAYHGAAFEPTPLMKTTLGKLMMMLIYGFASEDGIKTLSELEEKLVEIFDESGPVAILNSFPPLRFLLPSVKRTYHDILDVAHGYQKLGKEFTDRRRAQSGEKDPRIFIDHFLNLIGKTARTGLGIKILHYLFKHTYKKVQKILELARFTLNEKILLLLLVIIIRTRSGIIY